MAEGLGECTVGPPVGQGHGESYFGIFLTGITPCKTDQPLQCMELQEKEEAHKDISIQEISLERTYN